LRRWHQLSSIFNSMAIRVLSYDAIHGVAVLLDFDGKHTISVDIGSALDDRCKEWVNERLSTVVVIGYLEKPPVSPTSSSLEWILTWADLATPL
jgi:hypothetical protein